MIQLKRLLPLLLLAPSLAHAQVYLDTTRSEPFVRLANIPGITGVTNVSFSNADNGSVAITIPFAFNFFGVDYTRVNLSSNGFVTFGTEAATSQTNAVIPSTGSPNAYIAPLWDDLIHPAVANGRWGVVGAAPNRAVVIEAGTASRRTATTGTLYYQVWLFEGLEGHFEYRVTGDAVGVLDATIGYEGAAGRRGTNAGGCNPVNACSVVPDGTTFVTRRARPPELAGTLTVPVRGALAGVPVDALTTLRNLGVDTATSVMATVYLSTNTTLDANDVIVGTVGPIDVDARTAGTTTTARMLVPASLPLGDYVVIYDVDSADDWTEVDEADNTIALATRFANAYELVPGGPTIRAPVPINAGDTLSLAVTLQNDAVPATGPLTVELFASSDRVLSANDVSLGTVTVNLTGVDPQALVLDVPLPMLPFGGYYPIAVFDRAATFLEINETNNTVAGSTRFFVGPDFAVTSVTVPTTITNGTPISVRTRLDSAGAPYTGQVSYQLYASTDTLIDANDTLLGEYVVDWAQQDFRDDNQTVSMPVAPGRYYVVARIDSRGTIVEIDETNNVRASGSAPANAIDLSITAVTFLPTQVAPGQTATVTATLRSLGLAVTTPVPFGMYLSRDATLDAGDLALATSTVTIGAATTFSIVRRVRIPTGLTPGSYRIIATADPAGALPELLETNNTFASPTRLAIPGAELEVLSVSGTSTAVVGRPYPVTLTLTNRGVLDAPRFRYAYYVSTNPLIRLTDTRLLVSGTASIAAGATRTFRDAVVFPTPTTTTTLYLGVIADVFAEVPEVSEADNVGRVPTPIEVEVPRPSLVARTITGTLTGRSLALRATVENTGSADADLEVAYLLSTNAAISPADVVLGRGHLVVAAGATGATMDTVTVPASVAAGAYFLGAIVDPDGAIDEADEDDNVVVGAPVELIDAALMVVTERLPVARVGLPYRATLSASGGVAYAWSIASGALPAGLALDAATGVISGTPTGPGAATFTIGVSSGGSSGQRALTLDVAGTPPALDILTAALPAASAGRPYVATLQAIGGAAPLVWSATGLPAGLELSGDGVVSGTAPAESARVSVTVRDAIGAAAARTLALVVSADGLRITTIALPDATSGEDYCASAPVVLQASGGRPPYRWRLEAGAPTTGLELSSDGRLCGTPVRAGELLLDVRVTDSATVSATAPLVLYVSLGGGLAVTTTGLPEGVVGTAYTGALAASGGTAPYTFALVMDGGALPPGLALAGDGRLSGTPTLEGVFAFRVVASDGAGASAVQALFVAVTRTPPPPIPGMPMPSPSPTPPEPEGCSCAASSSTPASALPFLALVALAAVLRRRRPR